jgi:hypothetical protein
MDRVPFTPVADLRAGSKHVEVSERMVFCEARWLRIGEPGPNRKTDGDDDDSRHPAEVATDEAGPGDAPAR